MNKIIYFFVSSIQALTIAGIFILESLSRKKAGVNHHLIARKYQLQDGLYSSSNLVLLAFLIFAVVLLVFLLSIKLNKFKLIRFEFIKLLSIGLFFILAFNYIRIQELNSYAYILSASLIVFCLQLLLLAASSCNTRT